MAASRNSTGRTALFRIKIPWFITRGNGAGRRDGRHRRSMGMGRERAQTSSWMRRSAAVSSAVAGNARHANATAKMASTPRTRSGASCRSQTSVPVAAIQDRHLSAAIDPDQARQGGARLLGARSWPLSLSDLFRMSSDLCLVVLFGTGAAISAFMTKRIQHGYRHSRDRLAGRLRCETERTMGRFS